MEIKSVTLKWNLTGRGWATCSLRLGDDVVDVSTSFLGDALDSLLKSATDLGLGSSSTFAHLAQEPGCTRMFLSGARFEGVDRVYLQIVRFGGHRGDDNSWEEGRVLWQGIVSLDEFVSSVRLAAQAVLDTHGEEGYRRQWGKPFPRGTFDALNQVLESGSI